MKSKFKPKPLLIILICFIILIISFVMIFFYLVSPVDSKDNEDIKVVIEKGTSGSQICDVLKEKNIIKSKLLFKVYLRIYKVNSLKASTYRFKRSMSLKDVIKLLEDGYVSNDDALKLTFKPGERITNYAKVISDNTDSNYDDVIALMKDKEYLSGLINNYWFLTDKILDEDIYYPLEGYLAPDTYFFDRDVDVKTIVKTLLDEMEDNLEKYKTTMINDPHYYMTMASIVQLEGTNTENRKQIVGVFKNRLSSGYNLGSDVTTYYALQADMKEDLSAQQFATINPYNTRGANMIGKMPIGPICNPSNSSIEASINPDINDYLFFVADKHGNIFFTRTNQEHDKKVAEIKAKGDWIF